MGERPDMVPALQALLDANPAAVAALGALPDGCRSASTFHGVKHHHSERDKSELVLDVEERPDEGRRELGHDRVAVAAQPAYPRFRRRVGIDRRARMAASHHSAG